jgi:hypothetical protein
LQTTEKFTKAGIAIVIPAAGQIADIPELRITARMLAVPDAEQFVFHIETSLYRFVELPDKTDLRISSPVWAGSVTMQSAAADDINDAVTKAAMRQVEMFIKAWKAAQIKTSAEPNSKAKPLSVPGSKPSSSIKAAPSAPAKPAQGTSYISTKNSKVFHLAMCSAVKTISPENIVTLTSKEEALSSGRRPCKKCNP